MALKVINNFTVVDECSRGRQMGFRNLWNSSGEELMEVRFSGTDAFTMHMQDFKKFLLAGERMAELLAADQEVRDGEENNQASA